MALGSDGVENRKRSLDSLRFVAALGAVALLLWLAGAIAPSAALALVGGGGFVLLWTAWRAAASRPGAKAESGAAETKRSPSEAALLDGLPDPFLLLDGKRRVVVANKAAKRLFGRALDGGDIALHLRHPAALAAIEKAAESGAEAAAEFTLSGDAGQSFALRAARLVAKPAEIALHIRDVTALRHAEAMRADFVANASHELKTPLSSLIGFIETLQGKAGEDAASRRRFLGIMESEAARMARLIDDLLSLSRIERDERTPPRTRVAIPPLLSAAREALEPAAKARAVAISIEAAEDLPEVAADRDQMLQVLHNLLGNAIKYGREGGKVRISARPAEGEAPFPGPALAIAVSDDGPGIERLHLPRLTERFYRIDSGRSRALGGTGLGLAIVKHIVSRHRGHLAIESAPERGSTFTVYLPLERRC